MSAGSTPAVPQSRDETAGRNTAATLGLILGVVGIALTPVAALSLLVGFGAVVVSGYALNRASLMGQFGYAPIGKGKAMVGIALGVLGVLESWLFAGSMF